MMPGHHFIEDPFRHRWKNNNHQCANNGAAQHGEREEGIALQISKDTPDRFHIVASASLRAVGFTSRRPCRSIHNCKACKAVRLSRTSFRCYSEFQTETFFI